MHISDICISDMLKITTRFGHRIDDGKLFILVNDPSFDGGRPRAYEESVACELIEKHSHFWLQEVVKHPAFNPNQISASNLTPLCLAIRNGNSTAVEILLSNPITDVNRSFGGLSAFISAFVYFNRDVDEALLQIEGDKPHVYN